MSSEYIQRYSSSEYLNAFESLLIRSTTSKKYYPLNVKETSLQLIPTEKPNDFFDGVDNIDLNITEKHIDIIKHFLSNLCKYDLEVQRFTHSSTEFDFSLKMILFCFEEVHFRYWGDSYNSEWGAYFKQDENQEWHLYDWG